LRLTDAVPIFHGGPEKKLYQFSAKPGEQATVGALPVSFTATSPQLVGFAPRLLHNIAGLVRLDARRAVALGWENRG